MSKWSFGQMKPQRIVSKAINGCAILNDPQSTQHLLGLEIVNKK